MKAKQTEGQISISEYLNNKGSAFYCKDCVCQSCLYYFSERCPFGKCYDDWREKNNPFDKAHPGRPPRTMWSNWRTDQGFWCRGGVFYPAHYCSHWEPYHGLIVKECLGQNVCVFEDGYIRCGIIDTVGCEECYKRFLEKEW